MDGKRAPTAAEMLPQVREAEVKRSGLAALALCSVLALAACGTEEEGEPREPAAPPTSANSIPGAPLNGKLSGQPFEVKSGRYYVDRRPGFEKIDILLYAATSKTRCGKLDPEKPASVWLRRRGPEAVRPGEHRIEVDGTGKWEVHYQVMKDEQWVGNGDANALFVIDQVRPDLKLVGALSACFRDPRGSCVAGKFTADYCAIEIDEPIRGTKTMERPPPEKPGPKPAEADAGASDAQASDAEVER